jgi:hypothetical protein
LLIRVNHENIAIELFSRRAHQLALSSPRLTRQDYSPWRFMRAKFIQPGLWENFLPKDVLQVLSTHPIQWLTHPM